MRGLPRSLFGRNVLLLMALLVFGMACGALALREWAQKPRIDEIAELVARQIRLAQVNLELVPQARRESLRPWVNARARVEILPFSAHNLPAPSASSGLPARRFMNELRWRLPDAQETYWTAADGGTVWVLMRLGPQRYWFTEKGIALATSASATGIGILALAVTLSILGAIRIQRHLNRPLSRLVEGALRIGSGRRAAPLEENGPHEFQVVSRAFNQMTASLARADAERAVLLAGVSHDLRTPIAKMRLAIEMLEPHSDPELLESMLRSVTEMEVITEQFLSYAREEDRSAFVPMDLNALVLESAERHRRGSRSIIVRAESDCTVEVQRASLQRAIDNLIENALRYSEGDIEVETKSGETIVRVSVLDRGPGIPAAEVQTLKMPFTRGSAAIGKAGTGLGLAIVERVTNAHRGRFDLFPRNGGGTEARIELPLSSA